ncbi:MAG: dTDP-glucose 4,6-dehydratase [Acidobacteria bacterium]|nr:dTDP-glucose 4,6-dehydratase [Acidobacteriota bacterium]
MSIFLVTGGAGFIGSAFVRTLLNAYPDASVINIDALTYAGSMANLEGLDRQRHRFLHGDICDRDTVLKAIPENCDAVFNFAAESHVDRSLDSADKFIRTNVLGTQVLLDAVREKRVRRFIQISTDEVMGSLSENTEELFTESSPLRPNSPYAASKAAAEMLVRAAVVSHGVDAVITRSGNNYGPRQFPEKLIPLVIKNALDERPLPIYGDGMNVRDWIHVDDNCRAVLLAYEKGRSGETYNIGAGCQKRNLDVVRFILKEMNKPESLIEFVTDRPGHDRRYATDPNKAETELGWKPEIIWENGIKQTTAWYVDKWNKKRPLKK